MFLNPKGYILEQQRVRIIIWTGEAKIATETVLVCQSLFFSNGLLHFQDQHAGDGSGVTSKTVLRIDKQPLWTYHRNFFHFQNNPLDMRSSKIHWCLCIVRHHGKSVPNSDNQRTNRLDHIHQYLRKEPEFSFNMCFALFNYFNLNLIAIVERRRNIFNQ